IFMFFWWILFEKEGEEKRDGMGYWGEIKKRAFFFFEICNKKKKKKFCFCFFIFKTEEVKRDYPWARRREKQIFFYILLTTFLHYGVIYKEPLSCRESTKQTLNKVHARNQNLCKDKLATNRRVKA
ncbi:hypothetical protein, partial [Enterococcus faecium]|uniref:hypothetical protein n=1 Tax=Enterococcus faecium TaxID=1352 RepID=UPI0030C8C950